MKKVIAALLGVVMCATVAVNMPLAASAEQGDALDFSHFGEGNASISAANFLAAANYTLFEGEREYLNTYFADFALTYGNEIPERYAKIDEWNEAERLLTVSADSYSYLASNGKEVVWQPVSVDGVPFTDGKWIGLMDDSAPDFVSVEYNAPIAVPTSAVADVLNGYYDAAKLVFDNVSKKNAEYATALEDYNQKNELYEKYLEDSKEYEENSNRYSEYLKAYKTWKEKYDNYQTYLEEYAKYLEEKAAYDAFDADAAEKAYLEGVQRYEEYLEALKKYGELKKQYDESLKDPNVAKVVSQLATLAYMNSAVDGRSLHSAILGGTVTTVLANKAELIAVVPDVEDAIDLAEKATLNLRSLINEYDTRKDQTSQYLFYRDAYESLRDNFCNLFRALDHLYKAKSGLVSIRNVIIQMGKNEQFCVLLAQLHEICNALTDGDIKNYDGYTNPIAKYPYFDKNYLVDGKTISSILGDKTLFDTEDAVPLNVLPNIPEEPIMPEVVEYPVKEQAPPKPLEPEKIENPGSAPDEVKDPGSAPVQVEKPVPPVKYEPTEWESKLYAAFEGIELRDVSVENINVVLRTYVVKYFRNVTTIYVYYYMDRENAEPAYENVIRRGEISVYVGDEPTMEREGHTCVFDGWVDLEGNTVDWRNMPATVGSLNLYPHFSQTPNLYDVIWIIDGVQYPAQAEYGSIPVFNIPQFDGQPIKADEGYRHFRFIGWDREFELMTTDTVYYTAQFEASVLVEWKIADDIEVTSFWKGEAISYGSTPKLPADLRSYYQFEGWLDKNGAPVDLSGLVAQQDVRYTAKFSTHYIIPLYDTRGEFAGSATIERTADGILDVNCSLTQQKTFDISYLLQMAVEEDVGIIMHFLLPTLTFSRNEVYNLVDCGAKSIVVNASQSGQNEYSYSVAFLDEYDGEIDYDGLFILNAAGRFDTVNSHLYRTDKEGNTSEVRTTTFTAESISFSMRSGYVYEIYPSFSVSTVSVDGVEVTTSITIAKIKQRVTISVGELPEGRYLERIYVRDADGNEIAVSEYNTFVMPSSNVVVGVIVKLFEFTVTYFSEGALYITQTYTYGQELELPPAPYKAPDGEYEYTFEGWEGAVDVVTEDIQLHAVFSAKLLPVISNGGGGISKVKIIIIAAIVFVAIVIVLLVISVIVIVKRRKKRKK